MYVTQMHDEMELFICTFEVIINNDKRQDTVRAPRIMLEHRFKSMMYEAANSSMPIKIKISRMVPVYNQFDDEWIEREHSIVFANNAYTDVHKEEF